MAEVRRTEVRQVQLGVERMRGVGGTAEVCRLQDPINAERWANMWSGCEVWVGRPKCVGDTVGR